MARIPYVGLADAVPPDLAALFSLIAGRRGSVLNLYRALANQPPALRAFLGMSRYVRDRSSLPPRLRELAILATAYALDVPYEQDHHVTVARQVGVRDEQLAAFPNWSDADVFDPTERAVLAYADAVARTRTADDATFAELRARLSVQRIVDLTLTLGWYHLCAAIINPLEIEIESEANGP